MVLNLTFLIYGFGTNKPGVSKLKFDKNVVLKYCVADSLVKLIN